MTRCSMGVVGAVSLLAVAAVVSAQPATEPAPPAKGPRDLIKRSREARDREEMRQGAPAEGAPSAATSPHGRGARPEQRPMSSAEASDDVPKGTIRVRVVDADDKPVADATVRLGVMAQAGKRDAELAQTGSDGVARFEDLPTGESQAYRVTVPYRGATYGSTPFRLPPDRGYEVMIRRLPVTHDSRMLLQHIGQMSVELQDDRFKIVQQARLVNLGSETYVFPEEGQVVELPDGYMAFRTQESMSDQTLSEVEGAGFKITGSIPPGSSVLMWAYDLPIKGTSQSLSVPVPWRTFQYRVFTDAPPGMSVDVENMPDAQVHHEGGRRLFGTELQRRPDDPPLERLTLHFEGIPGPGPVRWVALALALGVLGVGVGFAYRARGRSRAMAGRALEERKEALLREAEELARLESEGEIGPQYREQETEAIVDELAVLLRQEQRRSSGAGKRASRSR